MVNIHKKEINETKERLFFHFNKEFLNIKEICDYYHFGRKKVTKLMANYDYINGRSHYYSISDISDAIIKAKYEEKCKKNHVYSTITYVA